MQTQINLTELASVDIQKVHKEELVDASDLRFDLQVPRELRAAYLLNAIGNLRIDFSKNNQNKKCKKSRCSNTFISCAS